MKLDFEKFLEANGLKLGDKIKLLNNKEIIYTIVVKNDGYPTLELVNKTLSLNIGYLFAFDFEVIKPKKTIGEMTCNYHLERYLCRDCIFEKLGINCEHWSDGTFNELKETFLKEHPLAEPLRPVIETELNKAVEE